MNADGLSVGSSRGSLGVDIEVARVTDTAALADMLKGRRYGWSIGLQASVVDLTQDCIGKRRL